MQAQLALLEESTEVTRPPEWRLDERTREVGRSGLAAAREALAQARRRAAA